MNIKIIDRIRKDFYITDYPTRTSGYITPDGEWIHLINKEDEDRGGWYRNDHRCIGSFLTHSGKITGYSSTEKMFYFMSKGYIRFMPEDNGFEFIKTPTKEQVEAIRIYNKYYADECCKIEKTSITKGYTETKLIGDYNDFLGYIRNKRR